MVRMYQCRGKWSNLNKKRPFNGCFQSVNIKMNKEKVCVKIVILKGLADKRVTKSGS